MNVRGLPLRRLAPALLALVAGGCATAPPPAAPVDLAPARTAVETAKKESSEEPAHTFVVRAEEHLARAEALGTSQKPEERTRAEGLAALAQTEAEAAATLSRVARERSVPEPAPATADVEKEKLRSRLARSVDEQRKLEERVALLQRDLDATETELIRSKAKLKGIETKAEASSAIAEARILMLRVMDAKNRSASVARSQEKLDRAERQLKEGNYGAAVFFALQAQELLDDARRSAEARPKK